MLFMYIHTHPLEKCLANKPQETEKLIAGVQEGVKKGVIKMIGMWSAPHEHTVYGVFEATDMAEVEKGLIPMTLWGTARIIPIITAEQVTQMK